MGLRTIGALAMAAVLAGLTGCAPDAWSNKQATGLNAFLNQIATQCAPLQLGRYNMSGMILRNDIGSTDAYNYFFDQTSRLYFGTLPAAAYRSSIDGFFEGPNAAVDCILSQLPPR